MWTLNRWKLKGCREIKETEGYCYSEFGSREEAVRELRKRLDASLVDAKARLFNAKKWIQRAQHFGLYPLEPKS